MKSLPELDRLLMLMEVSVESFAYWGDGAALPAGVSPDSLLVGYVVSGCVRTELSGREDRWCPAGTLMLIPPGLSPSFTRGYNRSAPKLALGMVRARVSGVGLLAGAQAPLIAELPKIGFVRQNALALIRCRQHEFLGVQALADSLMKTCILALLQDFFMRPGIDQKIISALADPRLSRAVAAVLESPASAHTLASMAGLAGLGRSAFSRLFCEALGQSPKKFLARVRLHQAAEILRSSKAPVKAIAATVGFASRSHFSQAFQDAYGVDPTSYRKSLETALVPVPQDLAQISPDRRRSELIG
ncbi:MAG TPA: AraC family transcriptional regulator [Allosphingosinicella sp.]|nr:AraC family transcriptional regulator [Allosphingosinicella sp.]